MLKYLYWKEIFAEVPGEISLGISISGCTIRCHGCHSKELWKDEGIPLTIDELQKLIDNHKGISCVCLFGGEHNIDELICLFSNIHDKIKTAWYCGLDEIPKDKTHIISYLDYVKIGHYDESLGGLSDPNTNQRFYHIIHLDNGLYVPDDWTQRFFK